MKIARAGFEDVEVTKCMSMGRARLTQGAVLMLIGSLAFIGYAVVFLFRNFTGAGFELGVDIWYAPCGVRAGSVHDLRGGSRWHDKQRA